MPEVGSVIEYVMLSFSGLSWLMGVALVQTCLLWANKSKMRLSRPPQCAISNLGVLTGRMLSGLTARPYSD